VIKLIKSTDEQEISLNDELCMYVEHRLATIIIQANVEILKR